MRIAKYEFNFGQLSIATHRFFLCEEEYNLEIKILTQEEIFAFNCFMAFLYTKKKYLERKV